MNNCAALLLALGLGGCVHATEVNPSADESQNHFQRLSSYSSLPPVDFSLRHVMDRTQSGLSCHYEMDIYFGDGKPSQQMSIQADNAGSIESVMVGSRALPSYESADGDDLQSWNTARSYFFSSLFSYGYVFDLAEGMLGNCSDE